MSGLEGGPNIESVPESIITAVRERAKEKLSGMSPEDLNIIVKLASNDLHQKLDSIIDQASQKRMDAKPH